MLTVNIEHIYLKEGGSLKNLRQIIKKNLRILQNLRFCTFLTGT